MIKRALVGFVMLAATAAPALAAGAGWNTPMRSGSAYAEPGYDAYAAAPMAEEPIMGEPMMGAPMAGAPPVYAYGRYQGSDPDPFIRQSLMRNGSQSISQY